VKKWSREHAEARNLELAVARTSKGGWFGNLSGTQFGSHAWRHSRTDEEVKADSGIYCGPSSGVTYEDIHEPSKKQSQSCCPKKSGFWVWTSGRLVNVLDEKDILVCVHIRNILWAWGCFRNVKVPSSPYKRGREGTCKRIQIFGTCAICWGNHCPNLVLELSRVREIIRIFRITPNNESTVHGKKDK
jgi:hypothetical protein